MTPPPATTHDILIIGAGPAGLAAATASARAGRGVVVFDSQEYRNDGVQAMHNVVLHDGENPATYRASAINNISEKYERVVFLDTEVTTARVLHSDAQKQSHVFDIATRGHKRYVGKKLILASGSVDIFSDIPGYTELWGSGR